PKRSESASMSWALLAITVPPRRTTCYPATPADMRTRYYHHSANSKRHADFFLIVCAVTSLQALQGSFRVPFGVVSDRFVETGCRPRISVAGARDSRSRRHTG